MAAKATTRKPAAADEDSKINASDQLYYEKTRNGDENFKTAQWTIARFYYMEASVSYTHLTLPTIYSV